MQVVPCKLFISCCCNAVVGQGIGTPSGKEDASQLQFLAKSAKCYLPVTCRCVFKRCGLTPILKALTLAQLLHRHLAWDDKQTRMLSLRLP